MSRPDRRAVAGRDAAAAARGLHRRRRRPVAALHQHRTTASFVLLAQSVPSATQLPCVGRVPGGLVVRGQHLVGARPLLARSRTGAGIHAVEVSLRASCDVTRRDRGTPGPRRGGHARLRRAGLAEPVSTGVRATCVSRVVASTTRSASPSGASSTLAIEADRRASRAPARHVVARGAGRRRAHPLRRRRAPVRGVASADADRPSPALWYASRCSARWASSCSRSDATRTGGAAHHAPVRRTVRPAMYDAVDHIRVAPLTWLFRFLNVVGGGVVTIPLRAIASDLPAGAPVVAPRAGFIAHVGRRPS